MFKTPSFLPLGAICLIAAASPGAHAASPTPEVQPDLVVSATRIPTPADQIASTVTVITAEEIARRQLITLPDALELVPGLNVVRTGGAGAVASVFMRGTNSNHVKVLIDGIDAADPSSPSNAFDFSQIQLPDIDRIEVLRGPQGALYGSDAVGGVILITTRHGTNGSHLTANAEAGSFGTFNQSVGIRGGEDRFTYALNYGHEQVARSEVVPDYVAVPGVPTRPDSVDNQTVSTRLGYRLTDLVDVGLVARYVEQFYKSNNGAGAVDATRNREWLSRATLQQASADGRFDQTLGLALTRYDRSAIDTGAESDSIYTGQRVKLDWQGNYQIIPGETLTGGAEASRETLTANAPLSAHQDQQAGFVQLQSAIGGHFFNTASLRVDNYQTFGSETTWRVAPAWLIESTGTKLKGSIGTAFKAPSLSDLYESYIYPSSPQYNFYANPNLKPETSTGFDVGFEQKWAGDAVRVGATFFHNAIRNLINENAAYNGLVNVGHATTQGVETSFDWTLSPALSLEASYTFTEAHDDTSHTTLLRRPKHKATFGGQFRASERLSLSATLIVLGPWADIQYAYPYARTMTGGGATANIAANYVLKDGWTLYGRINNLTDRRYQDPLGYLHEGIGIYAGLRVSLDAKQLSLWQ